VAGVDLLLNPEVWVAFLTLLALEIVLGIDNIVFISILVDKLLTPGARAAKCLDKSLEGER
jgi:predicted tellurium resistance membrane protein TerC